MLKMIYKHAKYETVLLAQNGKKNYIVNTVLHVWYGFFIMPVTVVVCKKIF